MDENEGDGRHVAYLKSSAVKINDHLYRAVWKKLRVGFRLNFTVYKGFV